MAGTKRIYVGMHDGVCVVTSEDGGKTWKQGPVTPWPMRRPGSARVLWLPPGRTWPHTRRGCTGRTTEV